jgi:hypothetical protein
MASSESSEVKKFKEKKLEHGKKTIKNRRAK